jgi:hypothetical protein
MSMTRHAQRRCQQRAIAPWVVDLLLQFGRSESAGDGARKVFMDKASRRRLAAYAGPMASAMEGHLDVYAVVGRDDCVITVAHRCKRIKRS